MTNLRSLLSKNIKKRREFLGISQAALAERVETSVHYISQIERKNKFPSTDMLERIAFALEFDTTDLFSTDNKEIIANLTNDISQKVNSALDDIFKQYTV